MSNWHLLRVFLSSPMHTDAWNALRTGLLELFETDPRCESYVLYGIERNPAPAVPREVYLAEVPTSHVLVVLLGEELRAPVQEEVQAALEHEIPVLAFRDSRMTPKDELKAWIERTIYPVTTVTEFDSLLSLYHSLRGALSGALDRAFVSPGRAGSTPENPPKYSK